MNYPDSKKLAEQLVHTLESQTNPSTKTQVDERVELTLDLMMDIFPRESIFHLPHPARLDSIIIGVLLPRFVINNAEAIEAMSYIIGMADTIELHSTHYGITLLCTIHNAFDDGHPEQDRVN